MGHTCKSRLCTSCSYKYKNERVENILETAYPCNHRQIVFTIPKELRPFFYYPYEEIIDILFEAVRDTIYSILNLSYKKNKPDKTKEYKSKTKWTTVFFAFLHTFGRDLKWNPHIHVLIAELKISGDKMSKWNYFDYEALSKRFQKILLDLLSKRLDKNIFSNELKKELFLNHKNGFYRKKPSCFDKINKLINKEKYSVRRMLLKHRLSIMKSFNRDPYTCPRCENILNYLLEMT